jgi:hypothetical protein
MSLAQKLAQEAKEQAQRQQQLASHINSLHECVINRTKTGNCQWSDNYKRVEVCYDLPIHKDLVTRNELSFDLTIEASQNLSKLFRSDGFEFVSYRFSDMNLSVFKFEVI